MYFSVDPNLLINTWVWVTLKDHFATFQHVNWSSLMFMLQLRFLFPTGSVSHRSAVDSSGTRTPVTSSVGFLNLKSCHDKVEAIVHHHDKRQKMYFKIIAIFIIARTMSSTLKLQLYRGVKPTVSISLDSPSMPGGQVPELYKALL